jgi:hypothetical protein
VAKARPRSPGGCVRRGAKPTRDKQLAGPRAGNPRPAARSSRTAATAARGRMVQGGPTTSTTTATSSSEGGRGTPTDHRATQRRALWVLARPPPAAVAAGVQEVPPTTLTDGKQQPTSTRSVRRSTLTRFADVCFASMCVVCRVSCVVHPHQGQAARTNAVLAQERVRTDDQLGRRTPSGTMSLTALRHQRTMYRWCVVDLRWLTFYLP